MARLARLLGAAALLAAGLVLPTGPAQAAACSGTTGVTVVIDYGSTSRTACAPSSSSAMSALRSVAQVEYPVQYPGTVVCRIDSVPSEQSCRQMPPSSAYWAFYHAKRGGSWTYSSVGAADYAPAPGSVIGFAFGAGARPSTAPPAASATPTPTPSSSSAARPSPSPTAARPSTPKPSGSVAPRANGVTSSTTSAPSSSASPTTRSAPGTTTPAPGTPTTSTTSTSSTSEPGGDETLTESAGTTVAAASSGEDGSPATLVAGLGLVGLVGAAAAYVALRRRADG